MRHLYTITQPVHHGRSWLPPTTRAGSAQERGFGGHIRNPTKGTNASFLLRPAAAHLRRGSGRLRLSLRWHPYRTAGGRRIGWDVDAKDHRIPKRGLNGSSSPVRVVGPARGRQDQRMFIGRRMADEALMHDSTLHHCAVAVRALSVWWVEGFVSGGGLRWPNTKLRRGQVDHAPMIWHCLRSKDPSTRPVKDELSRRSTASDSGRFMRANPNL